MLKVNKKFFPGMKFLIVIIILLRDVVLMVIYNMEDPRFG